MTETTKSSIPVCPTCGGIIGHGVLLAIANDRAQSHLEGGGTFNGGEVYASCPKCGEEIALKTEGYTEVQRAAVVTEAVIWR